LHRPVFSLFDKEIFATLSEVFTGVIDGFCIGDNHNVEIHAGFVLRTPIPRTQTEYSSFFVLREEWKEFGFPPFEPTQIKPATGHIFHIGMIHPEILVNFHPWLEGVSIVGILSVWQLESCSGGTVTLLSLATLCLIYRPEIG
jgi:hypothetical protein